MIRLKRVYEGPEPDDGKRVLVDRVWPRGISREKLKLDEWMKEIAPSTELRKWFGHKPERWEGFVERYQEELSHPEQKERVERLAKYASEGMLTLLFSARDKAHNQAVALAAVLTREQAGEAGA